MHCSVNIALKGLQEILYYRISSSKRRPQINAAPESQNINKRRPRINAAPLGAAFIRIFNKKLVYLKGS